jgi:hypothetical protein
MRAAYNNLPRAVLIIGGAARLGDTCDQMRGKGGGCPWRGTVQKKKKKEEGSIMA